MHSLHRAHPHLTHTVCVQTVFYQWVKSLCILTFLQSNKQLEEGLFELKKQRKTLAKKNRLEGPGVLAGKQLLINRNQ